MEKINLRTLLATTAALIVVAPTTVGILSSVGNDIVKRDDSKDQVVVDAINSQSYQLTNIAIKTKVQTILAMITADFIKAKLSAEIKTVFDNNAFEVKKITENGKDLDDSRLELAQTIYAEFHYDYGSITDQKTLLMIHVTGVDDEQIAFAISQEVYQTTTVINTPAQDIVNLITPEFIQTPLENDIKTAFNNKFFKFNNISVNQRQLEDNDLKVTGLIEAEIDYDYGSYKNYHATFKITVN